MKAGNVTYLSANELPKEIAIFPLSGALLLPDGQLPLNVFEPRYLEMIDDAIVGERLIAMVQPKGEPSKEEEISGDDIDLYEVGCLGRITAFQEAGDGRYLLNLSGICRYKIIEEIEQTKKYRSFAVEYFEQDLLNPTDDGLVNRERLLEVFRSYLDANQMEADWKSVEETDTIQLVNALCAMSPYGPAEKQALLEAKNLTIRSETLIAITEIELAKQEGAAGGALQ